MANLTCYAAPLKFDAPERDASTKLRVDRVTRAFNTWAFKREQPSDATAMADRVARAIAANKPVPFVMYWGKGLRDAVGIAEATTLAFWGQMGSRIAEVYQPGASLSLIYTDTHATLNGHSPASTQLYFRSVSDLAARQGVATHLLSDVIANAPQRFTDTDRNVEPSPHLHKALKNSAAKWYFGRADLDTAALEYFAMNMVERDAVEAMFSDHIFVTFNGSSLRSLFPRHMPIFYMYSLRKGCAVKPWFIDQAEAESAPTNSPE